MILLDLSMALMRTIFMNEQQVRDTPEFVSHIVLTQLTSFASKFGASKKNPLVAVMDSSSWRKKYYEENKGKFPDLANESYKGQRVRSDKYDWDTIFRIYNETMEGIKLHSDFFVMKVDGAEADDIIACLAKEFKERETIWVVSSDKDFIQLQDPPRVNLFDQHKQVFRPTMDVEQWKKVHILTGDSGDNIKPVRKGVGEKTAIKMIKELDVLLQTNPDLKARYEFNETLIDFSRIPDYVCGNILDEYAKQQFLYNGSKLLSTFIKFKLVKHAEGIDRFKLSDKEIKTKINSHYNEIQRIEEISKSNLEEFFS
jgi:5'-3' exonuclease